jgi:neutral ceramidase
MRSHQFISRIFQSKTVLSTVVLLACIPTSSCLADGAQHVLQAGAYAIDITPTKFPVESAGNLAPRVAEFAHDPLHARCLVLDNGETTIALAICDSCMIPRKIFDEAKRLASKATGIPTDHILCSATHTHSAVTATPVFQSKVEVEYCAYLTHRLAEGIEKAHSQLEPARIGWAIGSNPRQVFNRRWYMRSGFDMTNPFDRTTDNVRMNPPHANIKLLTPAGPTDPEVSILSVQATDGRPIALLANYSLHYVGGVTSKTLSADYFGEFANQFTRLIDARDAKPPFVGIMSNGTSADINNINFFEGAPHRQPFEQIRLVAVDVAESALAAYKRVEYLDLVPIKMSEAEVELGVRKPTGDEIVRARQILKEAGEGPYRDLRTVYALETLHMAKYPNTVSVKLQAIRIGGLGIVSSPCETFVETGLAIKKQSPLKPTFTIELANGYNGYLPTPQQHTLGGYETWRAKSSYLAVDSEPLVRSTLMNLLKEVAK